jgi:hypothetical protein
VNGDSFRQGFGERLLGGDYGQPTIFAALDEMNERWNPTVAI